MSTVGERVDRARFFTEIQAELVTARTREHELRRQMVGLESDNTLGHAELVKVRAEREDETKRADRAEEKLKDAREIIDRAREALRWCSGSADFARGGIAVEGWARIAIPALQAMDLFLGKPGANVSPPANWGEPPRSPDDEKRLARTVERVGTLEAEWTAAAERLSKLEAAGYHKDLQERLSALEGQLEELNAHRPTWAEVAAKDDTREHLSALAAKDRARLSALEAFRPALEMVERAYAGTKNQPEILERLSSLEAWRVKGTPAVIETLDRIERQTAERLAKLETLAHFPVKDLAELWTAVRALDEAYASTVESIDARLLSVEEITGRVPLRAGVSALTALAVDRAIARNRAAGVSVQPARKRVKVGHPYANTREIDRTGVVDQRSVIKARGKKGKKDAKMGKTEKGKGAK